MYEFYWKRHLEETDSGWFDDGSRMLIICAPYENCEVGFWDRGGIRTIIEFAAEEEISLGDVLNAFARDLESANYHREYDPISKIVQVMESELGHDAALKVMLQLVKKHGTIELFY